MNKIRILKLEGFEKFFQALKNLGAVYAPVKVSKQSFSFKRVQEADEISFDALRTILPPKKFFYPQEEQILKYSGDEISETIPKIEYQVIFGVHPCDLAGLGIMDTIYSAEPADTHYLRRREASMIVGLSCMPDKYCFCKSMGTDCPKSGYDIFVTKLPDCYFIEAQSSKGLEFLNSIQNLFRSPTDEDRDSYKDFWAKRDAAFTNGFEPDNLHSLLDMEWDNEVWKELGDRCLSCGNCTPVCPTCYCFDLVDIASLNGEEGERKRQWDSCQFVGFAQVAGEYNFRPTPVDRLKFWYRHKLHGFDDPYGFKTCVGCGRCTVSCPSGIDDIVGVVKALQEKKNGTKVTN